MARLVLCRFLRYIVGAVVVIVSVLIMPPVLSGFSRAATSFDVRKAASTLITDATSALISFVRLAALS